MLIKGKKYIDYDLVLPEHQVIHERMLNWARWCRFSNRHWTIHPMWRLLVAKERHENPVSFMPVDTIDAWEIEKAVSKLPEKHRFAVRWCYFYKCSPLVACRHVAVSKEQLAELVKDGRSMLINRLRK